MLETLSLGARAALASAVVHGSIAVAVATQLLPATGPRQPSPVVLIDVENDPAPFLPPPPPPVAPPVRQSVMPFPRASLDSRAHHPVTPAPPQPPASTPAAPIAREPMPAVASAPVNDLPVFRISMGGGGASPGASAPGVGAPAAEAEVLDVSSASALADRLYGPSPIYPQDAQAARIEADVPLLLLVDTSGHVTDVVVQRRAGYGLDEAAVAAVREWTFKPRTVEGRPIGVRVQWTMHFRLD